MSAAPETFQFGRFKLTPAKRALLADGVPVVLHARAFDILTLLVQSRDRVLSRDEIVGQVWRGLAVGDNNLAVQMSTLRRVLDEHGAGGKLIVTLPGRGYRFVGDVVMAGKEAGTLPPAPADATADPTGAPASAPGETPAARTGRQPLHRALLAATCVVALLAAAWAAHSWSARTPGAPRLSIAVLPFRNLGPDQAQDYLADALSDDLTTDLAHIPESVVIARGSADSFKGHALPAQQIGRALNVRYLVEGSVRAEDDQLHVNAQLVDAATGEHLWAERFDAPRRHLGEARDAIVRRLASALDFHLTQVESARSLHDRPDDPDAVDLFFQARAILDQNDTLEGIAAAQRLLEKAIAQQPNFGDALGVLGGALLAKVRDMDDPHENEDYAEAQDVVARALALAPRNAQALTVHAWMQSMSGDCLAARYGANLALGIEPNYAPAEALLAYCAQSLGNLEEAVPHLEAILRLDPKSPLNRTRSLMLGEIRLLEGQVGAALDLLNNAISGDPDPKPGMESMGRAEVARFLRIAAYDLESDSALARDLYKSYQAIWPHRSTWRLAAYFPKAVSKLAGFAKIMAALNRAGMPVFAGDAAVESAAGTQCQEGDFAATPAFLAGAETLTVEELAHRLQLKQPPVVIDLGRGRAVIPSAYWTDRASASDTPDAIVAGVLARQDGPAREAGIVIVGDGLYGCVAYRAAARLVAETHRRVAWLRLGEEGWAAKSQASEDRRP